MQASPTPTSRPTPAPSPESSPRLRRPRGRLVSLLTTAAVLAGLTTSLTGVADAADNPYERGPAPTTASIEATRGSYAVSQTTVSRTGATGFGGGTVYYPTSTSDGTFGAVAISPGFTASQSSVSWLGPRLASQGFVVITIDTLSTLDQPAARGDQLLSALDYLTRTSTLRTRIDSTRLGVMGHSMGGGGSLEASKDRPSLQAAIPLTPWNTDKTWPEVQTPTLIVGADGDTVAPDHGLSADPPSGPADRSCACTFVLAPYEG